jgi:hypothetical protein
LGIFGYTALWSIHELKQQTKRVRKGWFPKNPKHDEKKKISASDVIKEGRRIAPTALAESVFSIVYLVTILMTGALLVPRGDEATRFGVMAFILAAGDICHLVPRMLWKIGGKEFVAAIAYGKLIASFTMTVFYVCLWHVGLLHYALPGLGRFTALIYALAALRIVLCLLPQNKWAVNEQNIWRVWRNIPFFVLGVALVAVYAFGAAAKRDGLAALWIAIVISFACYIPVVLSEDRNHVIGMLMLPKSCAYAAIVLMGFTL